jgi:hypothetical protein
MLRFSKPSIRTEGVMQKKVYETPALEEAGSFEDVTLAIQGGAIVDQEFINAVVLGGPVPPGGAFS